MKKYVILDLDDTLLDFTRGEIEGVTTLLTEHGVTDTVHGLQVYQTINTAVWQQIEQGAPREPLLNTRFTKAFGALGISVDGVTLERRYHAMLDHNFYVLPGAQDFLDTLQKGQLTLIVGTNGTKTIQLNRLEGSGIAGYFDRLFISQDLGVDKPDPAFFNAIFAAYPDMTTANTIMVGDHLASDIQGALNSHLDSIWYNPHHDTNSEDIQPTYEVDSYAAAEHLLLND
ncbi:HAD superfamily hydrolase [Levilactobacillus paucivorans]|uniref:HAD superfamily hydrolase n=1 Tax=Levilactobacillus paucivorans TaxID=616990 RepID=A0A0R2LSD4_9LACO|nr:YjjG family noncanonical pyrimidine nucleotidase [Levilactobacillus paucivorans]KRO04182.1 HAD superfamily hydrolase [Levilactobacillus paucivorans]